MDKTHFCSESIQIKPLYNSCCTVHISFTENCKTKFFFLKHFVPLGAQVMINLRIEDQSQKDLDIASKFPAKEKLQVILRFDLS